MFNFQLHVRAGHWRKSQTSGVPQQSWGFTNFNYMDIQMVPFLNDFVNLALTTQLLQDKKKGASFRDTLRFRTTYITARKETPTWGAPAVCCYVIYEGPNFSVSQSTDTVRRNGQLCQEKSTIFYLLRLNASI